jgi:2',3'-cyclic-nucleotide 2'-phosphodiesterase (5'-nucleotidase family)
MHANSMKPRFHPTTMGALLAICASTLPSYAGVTGLKRHQATTMSSGSGEVVSFSPTNDTLAVTDNSAGGIRLFRHDGTSFNQHATVDVNAWFTANPVPGFAYRDVTSVALSKDGSGLGVATALNGSAVNVGGTNYTNSIPQQGRVVFFNLNDGTVLGSLPVGFHPDMVAINNGRIAIANEAEHAWNDDSVDIATFDAFQQPGSVSVIDAGAVNSGNLTTFDFSTLSVNTVDFSGVPALISGLRDHTSFETANTKAKHFHIEPEFIAFSPDNTKLFVSLQENNAIATLDLATLAWDAVTNLGQRPITIDASDQDDIFDVSNTALGLHMPDSIATWVKDGETYVITADEGDARVDDGDIQRFASAVSTYGLASGFTPSTNNNDYGRLNILKDQSLNGPVNTSSDIDKIVTMGTRGLSLWKKEADGSLGFISHLPLEAELFSRDPQRHNSNDGGLKSAFDARSDDKGPEPEAVAVTTLSDGTVIAVAGMERQNGVIVVDITNPLSPQVIRYINDSDAGLISPETVTIVDAPDSPTGSVIAIVGYEGNIDDDVAGGFGAYEINPPSFRLQVLHASDMEADTSSIATAPQFAALVDKLEDLATVSTSITIGAGDCFIPGAFMSAGNDITTRAALKTAQGFVFGYNATGVDLRENPGRPDIAIMNSIGFDATCIGNHEWDLGPTEFANIVLPDPRTSRTNMRHYGSAFPFLSANLDFSADSTLNARYTSAIRNTGAFAPHPNENYPGLNASPTNAKLAKSAIIERGGEKIGVIGVTPPDLASISSPGLVTVTGPQGAVVVSPRTYDIDALATHLQPTIDALVDAGCNKIVMATQLQQIDNEKLLATKLRHVDIVVAGGSGTIMAKPGTVLQPGDGIAENYPFTTTDLDGHTVAIVSGEGQYQYLGRLVADFDADGHITGIDSASNIITVNATEVSNLWGSDDAYAAGTRAATVKAVTDAVNAVIAAKDGVILGKSSVYLEGRRNNVRQQETNLGNLSAEANLWYAKQVDPTVEVSIKNGGGIRNPIGTVDAGGNLLPTAANAGAGKLAGDISRLDVEDSLKFNNALTMLTVTAQQLKVLLEHGVAGSNGTGADKATPGQFCQLAGIIVVADLSEAAVTYTSAGSPPVISAVNGGSRIRYAALTDSSGNPAEVLVSNGIVLNPGREIRLVTLGFLADSSPPGSDFGGDSYPFPWALRNLATSNRMNQTSDGSANAFTFAAAGTEQDAFAEYLGTFHATTPYAGEDTVVGLDRRIIQGTTDSDGDGFSNAIEVAALGLDPDNANTTHEINAALAGIRTAGRADVISNPGPYSLYTSDSIQDLRGKGNLLVQAAGPDVTLSLPLEKSTGLDSWEPAGELDITFPKTADKEFYRLSLPE